MIAPVEQYFRDKKVVFIHNAEIQVVDDSGNLALDSKDEKKPTLKGLLVTQGNNSKNRIIYEAGSAITFQMESEGLLKLETVMNTQPVHKAKVRNHQKKDFDIVNERAPCVLSWDFNTDKENKKADSEQIQGNDGRTDRNELKFGVTNWPVAQPQEAGHLADKAASVDPQREQARAGKLSHRVTWRQQDLNQQGQPVPPIIPDDHQTVTIVFDPRAHTPNAPNPNHRKTYTMRAVFGFNKDKTPQKLWEDGKEERYVLQGAAAGQYRAYDFTLRVALEKFVGQPIPPEKKPIQNADGTWNFAEANKWLHETFNTPSLTNQQVNDLTSGAAQLPMPEQSWTWQVCTSNDGQLYDGLKEVTVRFGLTPQQSDAARVELVDYLAALGAADQVAARTINNLSVKSYLGRWIQMAAEGAEFTGAGARHKEWYDDKRKLIAVTLCGIGVRPLVFTAGATENSPITQDEIRAALIHEFKHLRQFENISADPNKSPYWKLWDCKVRLGIEPETTPERHRPFHELEAYLEEMIDPRVSYRYLLKRGTILYFLIYYNVARNLVDSRPPDDRFGLGVGGEKRTAALQILERAWKIVRKTYPELQEAGHEFNPMLKPVESEDENGREDFEHWDK